MSRLETPRPTASAQTGMLRVARIAKRTVVWSLVALALFLFWRLYFEPALFDVPPLDPHSRYTYRTSMSMVTIELEGLSPGSDKLPIAVPAAYLPLTSQRVGGFQKFVNLHANLEDLSPWSWFLEKYHQENNYVLFSEQKKRNERIKILNNKLELRVSYMVRKVSFSDILRWRKDAVPEYEKEKIDETKHYINYAINRGTKFKKRIRAGFVVIPKSKASRTVSVECMKSRILCVGTAYSENKFSIRYYVPRNKIEYFEKYEKRSFELLRKLSTSTQ